MLPQFKESNNEDSEEMESDRDYPDVDIDWDGLEKKYEVISQGPDGFDRVTRPDIKSARKAQEAHESATSQEAEINLL